MIIWYDYKYEYNNTVDLQEKKYSPNSLIEKT